MRHCLLFFTAITLLGAPALAGPYFVEVIGGYNTLDMSTVNEFFDGVNDDNGVDALQHLDSCGSFGVALGWVQNRNMATSIAYERLSASEESSSPEVVMKLKAPANVIRFQLAYALAKLGPVIPFVQGGAGIIWNNGYLEYEDENSRIIHLDSSGSGLTFEGLIGAEVRLSDRFGLNLAGGYRFANISETKWDTWDLGGTGTVGGPDFDYSGAMVRVGLRIGLNWELGESSESENESENESEDATGWM